MNTRVIATSKYTHPEIGMINVRVVASARSIRAYWEGSVMHVTVPPCLPVDTYDDFIEKNVPRFLEMKPSPRFHIGQVIDGGEVDFKIVKGGIPGRDKAILVNVSQENLRPGKIYNICLNVPGRMAAEEMDAPEVQTHINKLLLKMAEKSVATFVIPHAQELALKIGRKPTGWCVKNKKRSLGTCDHDGFISLSPRLIFLPRRLRDFVILHELAHLSEMNHSRAFHELCNQYCGGRERELLAEIKSFSFPVF